MQILIAKMMAKLYLISFRKYLKTMMMKMNEPAYTPEEGTHARAYAKLEYERREL